MELPAVNLKVGAAGLSRSRASPAGRGPLRLSRGRPLARSVSERAGCPRRGRGLRGAGRGPGMRSGRAARGFLPGRRRSSSAAARGRQRRGAAGWRPGERALGPACPLLSHAGQLRAWSGDVEASEEERLMFLNLFHHMGKRCKSSWSLRPAGNDSKVLSSGQLLKWPRTGLGQQLVINLCPWKFPAQLTRANPG